MDRAKNYHPQWLAPEVLKIFKRIFLNFYFNVLIFFFTIFFRRPCPNLPNVSIQKLPTCGVLPFYYGNSAPEKFHFQVQKIRNFFLFFFVKKLRKIFHKHFQFSDLTPMEAGMKIATEGLRIELTPGISQHMIKLIKICMNEDPGKRPSFEQVLTVLEKMRKTTN